MGCSLTKSAVINEPSRRPTRPQILDPNEIEIDADFLQRLSAEFQDYDFRKLKDEFYNDTSMFILNQLLYSVQLFDNFEKATKQAKEYQIDLEAKLNKTLHDNRIFGVNGGDVKVSLMSGMGKVLAENVVYVAKPYQKDGRAEVTSLEEHIHSLSKRGQLDPTSFTCDGILPLDFYVNHNNFEVHLDEESTISEDLNYSVLKHEPPIFRLTMEVPDSKNQIPQGYVRLLVEREKSRRASVEFVGLETNGNYDYSNATDAYTDGVSEAKSSYPSSLLSEEDTESMMNMTPGEKLLHRREKLIRAPKPPIMRPGLTPRTEAIEASHGLEILDRYNTEGLMPNNYPTPFSKPYATPPPNLPGINETENMPRIQIDPPLSSSPPTSPLYHTARRPPRNGFLSSFHSSTERLSPPRSAEKRTDTREKSQQRSPLPSQTPELSSGYDSMSGASAQSKILFSLPHSADIRRRPLRLKALWQYQRANPITLMTMNLLSEISPDCLIHIKIERDILDASDDSDTSSTSSDVFVKEEDSDSEIRTYLSSTQVSASFFGDFNKIGVDLGLSHQSIYEAQVLGATVRCCVDCTSPLGKSYKILHTFTPTFRCNQWPNNHKVRFLARLRHGDSKPEELEWPTENQIHGILEQGCRVVPQGFYSTQFFHRTQSLEWLLAFPDAESLLLSGFQHAHWRAYIFSSLLLRAFVFPYGPLGIGLEHVRNIIYQLCSQDFVFWNEQEGGLQLRTILERLDESLSKPKLNNFFVGSCNMLKSTAKESTLVVKNALKAVRENLIIHCIYSLKNLVQLKPTQERYPLPELKTLYRILTVQADEQLLYVLNTKLLPMPKVRITDDDDRNDPSHEEIEAAFREQMIPSIPYLEDKKQRKLRNAYRRFQKEQEALRRAREAAQSEEQASARIVKEKTRGPIDLAVLPVPVFSSKRLVYIIDYFVKHFLEMAACGVELEAYVEASGYTLHVENLCRLLREMNLRGTYLHEWNIQEYEEKAAYLRGRLGAKIHDYVRAKLSYMKLPTGTSLALLGLSSGEDQTDQERGPNFELRSRNPDVSPADTADAGRRKLFPRPDISLTVQQFPMTDEPATDYDEEEALPDFEHPRRSRGETLLFLENYNRSDTSIQVSKRPSMTSFSDAIPGPSSALK